MIWSKSLSIAINKCFIKARVALSNLLVTDHAKTAKLYKLVRPLKAWVKKVVKSKDAAKKWSQTFKGLKV